MILDGKKAAEIITKKVSDEVALIKDTITLALILVGENPASQVYVRNKQKACIEVGINFQGYFLDANVPQKEVLAIIRSATPIRKSMGSWCRCLCHRTSTPTSF